MSIFFSVHQGNCSILWFILKPPFRLLNTSYSHGTKVMYIWIHMSWGMICYFVIYFFRPGCEGMPWCVNLYGIFIRNAYFLLPSEISNEYLFNQEEGHESHIKNPWIHLRYPLPPPSPTSPTHHHSAVCYDQRLATFRRLSPVEK